MRKSVRGNSGIPNEDSDYLRLMIGHLQEKNPIVLHKYGRKEYLPHLRETSAPSDRLSHPGGAFQD